MDRPTDNTDPVEAWLQTATRGLWDKAQLRIRAEVLAHLAEAIQSRVEDGQPEAQAKQDALAGLGDPNQARRAFRRVHLTASEAGKLKQILKSRLISQEKSFIPRGLISSLIGLAFAILGATLLMTCLFHPGSDFYSEIIQSMGIFLFGCGMLMQSLNHFFNSIRERLLLHEFGELLKSLGIPVMALCYPIHDKMGLTFYIVVIVVLGYGINISLVITPLWRKLRHRDDFEQIRDDLTME